MSLFSTKEQALLVSTEADRMAELSEDEIGDLLVRVRRARNKYSGLHRRQAAGSVASAGKRYAATSSNTRTLRKAEIFEDTLSRVSLALSRAARGSASELKRERIDAARRERTGARGAGSNGAEQRRRRATGQRAATRRRADADRREGDGHEVGLHPRVHGAPPGQTRQPLTERDSAIEVGIEHR